MNPGERQVSKTLDGIRKDHLNRYYWAITKLPKGSVVDAASGVGYGSFILAKNGFYVRSIERDKEAVEYGENHYFHDNIFRQNIDLNLANMGIDPVVAFEIIEHIEDPLPFLSKCRNLLLASVPNEDVFPYRGHAYHYRHYTKNEFEELLNKAGYEVNSWYGQEGTEGEVKENLNGRTLIAMATKR